jgi:S1-C subfamily serine protease
MRLIIVSLFSFATAYHWHMTEIGATRRTEELDEPESRTGLMRSVLRSVVKVMTVSDAPDYDQPWQTAGPDSAVGSGVIVMTTRGIRVLTNAHVVQNQVFIEVRRYGKSRKFVAEIESVGHVCDLALLKVEDPDFAGNAPPIPIAELPVLGNRVSVLGFPIGGDRLSITEGIVSRIEMSPYAHSQRTLLAVQIDAAINAGNSGGPVVKDGELVGIAFEALDEAENVGYMIGAPVVKHFLQDIADGIQDGFPDLGIVTQQLESKSHRRSLGLSANSHSGVLITGVAYGSSAWGILEKGDVLLMVDGKNVAADGTIRFRKGERIEFTHQIAMHHVGETMRVKVWREGAMRRFDIPLKRPRFLVAEDSYDIKPTYYLYGGLLFVPLSRDFLTTWGPDWWLEAPSELVSIYQHEICSPARTHRVNQGYHGFEALAIERVQGRKIRDLRELIRIVESATDDFIRFQGHEGSVIVLDRDLVDQGNRRVMRRYGVAFDRSEDLRK